MKPYPLDRPVSLSIMSWIPSICGNIEDYNECIYRSSKKKYIRCLYNSSLTFPKGSKIPRSISSVMLKCSEPTYSRIGPELPFCRLLAAAAALFFSACDKYIDVIVSIQHIYAEFICSKVCEELLFHSNRKTLQSVFRLSYHNL